MLVHFQIWNYLWKATLHQGSYFFWLVLVSNDHVCKGEAIKLTPYHLIDTNDKTVKLSHLKKLQIIQSIKNLMSQVIFIFSHYSLTKQIIVCSIPFHCWRKQIFERMQPEGMRNFLLPSAWWQELGDEFCVGRGMSKNSLNQCIFYKCELHKFENFSHILWNIKVWEKIQQAFLREIKGSL